MWQSVLLLTWITLPSPSTGRPNFVFIMADDLGYNDVGYHKSIIKTPTIDRLALEGVRLENYYVQPVCTPSRSSFLSGRYQIHTGLQHGVIMPTQPFALPLDSPTLAEKLKEAGYSTYAVGKWHLGFYTKKYLPTRRGFDKFYGFYMGAKDHYTHTRCVYNRCAIDLHDDTPTTFRNVFNESGTYSTHLFTQKAVDLISTQHRKKPFFLFLSYQAVHSPLQVPTRYKKKYQGIRNLKRKKFAAMTTAMDEGVRKVVAALKGRGLWKNTVLVFTTDNGANPSDGGSNYPLKGKKGQLYEGGIRGVAFVASPLLVKKGYINTGLIHISDWFPTILKLAKGNMDGTRDIAGIDQWRTIRLGLPSGRDNILHNIDPLCYSVDHPVGNYSNIFDIKMCAAIRVGDYKLITGPAIRKRKRNKAKRRRNKNKAPINETKLIQLYNIKNDPNEKNDLATKRPQQVTEMLTMLAQYYKTSVPAMKPMRDIVKPKFSAWGPWR